MPGRLALPTKASPRRTEKVGSLHVGFGDFSRRVLAIIRGLLVQRLSTAIDGVYNGTQDWYERWQG